jgi:NTE family protein
MSQRKTVGLVLGCGSSRGWAHIGVIEALEEAHVPINIMQDRKTRVNLAVTPPDVLIQPHLGDLKMLDFDQVEHTIEEGYVRANEKIGEITALFQKESFKI